MPHMTQGYLFELKVLEFAANLAASLSGDRRTFLMVLDSEGAVRTLQFEPSESSWPDLIQRLNEADESHLFYDPFDPLEYVWISWHKIERSTMERLIGKQFDEGDFVKHPRAALRAPELEPPHTFPVSWGVMF